MLTLELHQLDLRYSRLRIADPSRRARLEASIAQHGQQVPVLVVPSEAPRYVLIEGYGRVDALRRLARDLVRAIVLEVPESEALVLRHRLEQASTRSALEEGWLIGALLEHGVSQVEVAIALAKSAAWVSGRLALVRTLPECAQAAVRCGRIGANAAEKYLVPMSRVSAGQCATLVERLGSVRPSLRQLGRLYIAWRAADPETRQHIVEHPLLYLRAEEAAKESEDDVTVLRDVEAVAGVCSRARRSLREGAFVRLPMHRRSELQAAWTEAQLAFAALSRLLGEEGVHA